MYERVDQEGYERQMRDQSEETKLEMTEVLLKWLSFGLKSPELRMQWVRVLGRRYQSVCCSFEIQNRSLSSNSFPTFSSVKVKNTKKLDSPYCFTKVV